MSSFDYIIADEVGLHARPATLLVKYVESLSSKVTVTKGEKSADGKRMFSLMGLAIKHGETITFTLEGDNEATEMVALEQFCKETF